MSQTTTTHFRTCHVCEAMCGVAIDTEGERIVAIRGDRDDPLSRGHICPKAYALKDVHEDPDRLKTPLRRVGPDRWEPIGWDAALELTAERLHAIQRAHGGDAVGLYLGNPNVHNYGTLLFGQLLLARLGTRNRFSATSVDQLPHMLASLLMFGHQLLVPIPDVDRTDFFLVLGANPMVSNGSMMTAPDIGHRLAAIRARGGRVVVVDPRRTQTAEVADAHFFVRPGTDALLLAALVRTVLEEGLARPGHTASFTDGLAEVRAAVAPFSPEAVAPAVGIDAAAIAQLARDFARAERAACYGRVGVSTQEFGGLACWLINVLNAVTGNLDRAGGVMFTRPAVDLLRYTSRGHFDKGRSRVRELPEFGGEYPVSTLAEEIETPGPGQIRALITAAGNPVLSTPNGARLDRALARLEFMVAIDIYRNETTRHAHLILPPTFGVEHDHYDLIFHALAVRNTAKYSPALFAPAPDARHDWQILLDLATRLSLARTPRGPAALRARAERAALARLGPHGVIDLGLRAGPYGVLSPRGRSVSRAGLSLAALKRAPHGVDLGALEPCLPARLFTRDKRVALAPARLVADVPRLRARLEALRTAATAADTAATTPRPLALIGRRDLRTNNSWLHNSERFVKGRDRCTLLMHPRDAAARGLADAQRVRVRSRVGAVDAALEVTDAVMEGVVSLPHGWGHDKGPLALRVASAHPGVSVNDLTDDALVDALAGTASLSGVPVEVTAAE